MKNIGARQKRVVKRIRRNDNIGGYRTNLLRIVIYTNRMIRISEELINSIDKDLINIKGLTKGRLSKIFKIEIRITANKTLTNKGILVRMGGGKAKTRTNVYYSTIGRPSIIFTPIKSNTPINQILVLKLLSKFITKYPFFSFYLSL